jgi:hypothetical protein
VHGKQKARPVRFCTNPKGQFLQLKLPNVPTLSKNVPCSQFVQEDSALLPVLSAPYLPVSQLMQADFSVTPISELHVPLGHPLH